MASANKPRKIGFPAIFHTSSPTNVATPSIPTATRLQVGTPTFTINLLKRRREDGVEDDRPIKQARRDSAVDSQHARMHKLIQGPPSTAQRSCTLLDNEYRKTAVFQAVEQMRRERAGPSAAAHARAQKQQAQTEIRPQISSWQSVRDDKVYNPHKNTPSGSETENEYVGESAEAEASELEEASQVTEHTQPPMFGSAKQTRSVEKDSRLQRLQTELAIERETTRSKSAQVLRLINTNTEQKHASRQAITDLETQRTQLEEALGKKTTEVHDLRKEKREVELNKNEQIDQLTSRNAELEREKAGVVTQLKDFEAEVKRLNARNNYLQSSAKNAADTEYKVGQINSDLQAQLKEANNVRDEANVERDAALADADNAESQTKHYKKLAAAMIEALRTVGADVGGAANLLHSNTNMDVEDEEDSNTMNWRDYVTLPGLGAHGSLLSQPSQPGSQPSPYARPLLFGRQPSDNATGTGFDSTTASVPASTGFGSFGQPSVINSTASAQGKPSDHQIEDVERSLRELSRELEANKKQSSELQAWAAKKENGEQAPPPPNYNQMAFAQFVDNMVTDKLNNGMNTSSGETTRIFHPNGDIGMSDAPIVFGSDPYSSAYVDFANAETFGPDGWPMQTDDNAYSKAVSRQNNKFSGDKKFKNSEGGKLWAKNRGDFKHDNCAGKREGLDIHMGNNETLDHSKEEHIFSKKYKNDKGQNGTNNKRGKHNNPNKSRAGKNDRGRGGRFNDRGNDNNNNSNGNGGFRGGRGGHDQSGCGNSRGRGDSRGGSHRRGRSGGRGGRGSLFGGGVPSVEMMETGQLILGYHGTDLNQTKVNEANIKWDERISSLEASDNYGAVGGADFADERDNSFDNNWSGAYDEGSSNGGGFAHAQGSFKVHPPTGPKAMRYLHLAQNRRPRNPISTSCGKGTSPHILSSLRGNTTNMNKCLSTMPCFPGPKRRGKTPITNELYAPNPEPKQQKLAESLGATIWKDPELVRAMQRDQQDMYADARAENEKRRQAAKGGRH